MNDLQRTLTGYALFLVPTLAVVAAALVVPYYPIGTPKVRPKESRALIVKEQTYVPQVAVTDRQGSAGPWIDTPGFRMLEVTDKKVYGGELVGAPTESAVAIGQRFFVHIYTDELTIEPTTKTVTGTRNKRCLVEGVIEGILYEQKTPQQAATIYRVSRVPFDDRPSLEAELKWIGCGKEGAPIRYRTF